MSRKRAAASALPAQRAIARALDDARPGPKKCAVVPSDSDIVLTDADREFLDYIADAAIELYFARNGGAK